MMVIGHRPGVTLLETDTLTVGLDNDQSVGWWAAPSVLPGQT